MLASGLVVFVLASTVGAVAAGPALASDAESIQVTAEINGRAVGGSSSNDPVVIDPSEPTTLDLVVANRSPRPLVVAWVGLAGEAFGVPLVNFYANPSPAGGSTVVIAPRTDQRLTIPVALFDLQSQVSGLLVGRIDLLDARQGVLASTEFVMDAKGSAFSAINVFGLATAVLTAVAVVGVLTAVRRGTLPSNPARRGLRFGLIGLGAGTVLTLGLSVLRIAAPTAWVWVPVCALPALAAAVLGVLSPGPGVVAVGGSSNDRLPEPGGGASPPPPAELGA